jgi:hypothetical protein
MLPTFSFQRFAQADHRYLAPRECTVGETSFRQQILFLLIQE